MGWKCLWCCDDVGASWSDGLHTKRPCWAAGCQLWCNYTGWPLNLVLFTPAYSEYCTRIAPQATCDVTNPASPCLTCSCIVLEADFKTLIWFRLGLLGGHAGSQPDTPRVNQYFSFSCCPTGNIRVTSQTVLQEIRFVRM